MKAGTQPRGFVLVNALVIVVALSVVALALLTRAEGGRARVLAAGQAVQLELYLDAYEALAQALLNADRSAIDHWDEPWAREDNALPLDRGVVSGGLRDLQAGFNLNWLTNPEDTEIQEAFDRLLLRLGVSAHVGEQIRQALGPGGSGQARLRGVAENLPGGAALMLDQLPIPDNAMQRLRPHVAVLPGGSQLNVNTAGTDVLVSLLPGINPAALDTLLRTRKSRPFSSVEDFSSRLVDAVGPEQAEALNTGRLSVGSVWFEVRISAGLEGRVATRLVRLRRLPLPAGAQVAYRLDRW